MYDRKKNRSAQNVMDVSFFCSDVMFILYASYLALIDGRILR